MKRRKIIIKEIAVFVITLNTNIFGKKLAYLMPMIKEKGIRLDEENTDINNMNDKIIQK